MPSTIALRSAAICLKRSPRGRPPAESPGFMQIAERHEVATLAATVIVAVPPLRRIVHLNCKCPVTRGLFLSAVEEAGRAGFCPYLLELGKCHAIERRNLLKRNLRHQSVDVDVRLLLGCHGKRRMMSAMIHWRPWHRHTRCPS